MSKLRNFALRPSRWLLTWLAGLIGVAIIMAFMRAFGLMTEGVQLLSGAWLITLFGLLLIALFDGLNRPQDDAISLQRVLPKSFSLNKEQKLSVHVENHLEHPLRTQFIDVTPAYFEHTAFPLSQEVQAGSKGTFEYSVIPKRRGEARFARPYLLIGSKLGFWEHILRPKVVDRARVFPDFSAVSSSFGLGVEQAMRNIGAHLSVRRGDGLEFHQLREFRDGDTLKQVDWNATARVGTPIAREFQEEKDQNIVFLLDCSRRMRAVDRQLSYFDHCLNALLITSYVALDKGDAVGVMTFSGQNSWLPPIKGKQSINSLLNHLYDLDTSTLVSDFSGAANGLLKKHRKRSLIVLMTNFRDESLDDLVTAVDTLKRHHLVIVAVIREQLLEQVEEIGIQDQDDAKLYLGIKQHAMTRRRTLAKIKSLGVSVVDASSHTLQIKLVNEYLRLKRSGRL